MTQELSDDVISSTKAFEDLFIDQNLCSALRAAGFQHPSPVQEAALPVVLAGSDALVQAKSGTGKSVVIAAVCLTVARGESALGPKALVVAPTREVANQIQSVIVAVGKTFCPTLICLACIGGLPVQDDQHQLRRSHDVVVGTPGRLCGLAANGHLRLSSVKAFLLDEADALLADSMYPDVADLYECLPKRKQVVALSATFTDEALEAVLPMLKKPQRIALCQEGASLKGVRQLYAVVEPHASQEKASSVAAADGEASDQVTSASAAAVATAKATQLRSVLSTVQFNQVLVFCNDAPAAQWLADWLRMHAVPAAHIRARLPQTERNAVMAALRAFELRVVVTSDLLARGVDLEYVNLVVNFDLPRDAETYMHRVGRTGRFGTSGIAVTFVQPEDLATLQGWLDSVGGGADVLEELPKNVPAQWYAGKAFTGAAAEAFAVQGASQLSASAVPAPLPSRGRSNSDGSRSLSTAAGAAMWPRSLSAQNDQQTPLHHTQLQGNIALSAASAPLGTAGTGSTGGALPQFPVPPQPDELAAVAPEAQWQAWERHQRDVASVLDRCSELTPELLSQGRVRTCSEAQQRPPTRADPALRASLNREARSTLRPSDALLHRVLHAAEDAPGHGTADAGCIEAESSAARDWARNLVQSLTELQTRALEVELIQRRLQQGLSEVEAASQHYMSSSAS